MNTINQWFASHDLNSWVIKVAVVIFISLILSLLMRALLGRLRVKAQKTVNPWDDVFVETVGSPLLLLIWVVGLTTAIELIQKDVGKTVIEDVDLFRDIGMILAIAWFLVRFIQLFQTTVLSRGEDVDRAAVQAVAKLLRLTVFVIATLVVLQTLGVSIAGVLTFGGVGGIAVGFAAKDLLANFFGGLMIYLDRPFSVGDWIRSPDRSIEGTVEDIGWRMTRIRTFDSRPLYVPNSSFSTISIENPSRMHNRQIYEVIGIRYEDAKLMRAIVNDVTDYLRNHQDIAQDQTLMVNFTKFADSSLDFFIYCFTKTKKWAEFTQIKQDLLLDVLGIIESHGAQCAFPTSTLHINSGELIGQSKEEG